MFSQRLTYSSTSCPFSSIYTLKSWSPAFPTPFFLVFTSSQILSPLLSVIMQFDLVKPAASPIFNQLFLRMLGPLPGWIKWHSPPRLYDYSPHCHVKWIYITHLTHYQVWLTGYSSLLWKCLTHWLLCFTRNTPLLCEYLRAHCCFLFVTFMSSIQPVIWILDLLPNLFSQK